MITSILCSLNWNFIFCIF